VFSSWWITVNSCSRK